MFIHDWDRHHDQWRWAVFKEADKTVYRPIPRDRDQVYYKFEGFFPTLVAFFREKKFKTFKDKVQDVPYQNYNGMHFDRSFLHELEWSEWKPIVIELQEKLTDSIIDQAMNDFPKEIKQKNKLEVTEKLKARRSTLLSDARKLYKFLSRQVHIPGSDHEELFLVERMEDESVRVQVFLMKNNKKKVLKYDRTFYPKETRIIRLYGRRGKDQFEINGTNKGKIKITIIGGEGNDQLHNNSFTIKRKTKVYDDKDGIRLKGPGKVKDFRSDNLYVNRYNESWFKYNQWFPLVDFGYTHDDGIWLGGGATMTRYAWRKKEYASKHNFTVKTAPASRRTFALKYSGDFTEAVFGTFDFLPEVNLQNPVYENYFGLGNETIDDAATEEFNWVRMAKYSVFPMLGKQWLGDKFAVQFGPVYENIRIKQVENRVADTPEFAEDIKPKTYLGAKMIAQAALVDNNIMPESGVRFIFGVDYRREVEAAKNITSWKAQGIFYTTLLHRPIVTLANNIGVEKMYGDPVFYYYPSLGNRAYLRGFRNQRFRGQRVFYHNVDLRVNLTYWDNIYLPMHVGILGGFDYGRVWMQEENSKKMHYSYTAGIWLNLVSRVVVQSYYSITKEGNQISLGLGFNF